MAIATTLVPMIPVILLCCSIIGVIRRLDEMQLRLQLEAFALAFAGTALITFSYGFLENVGVRRLASHVRALGGRARRGVPALQINSRI